MKSTVGVNCFIVVIIVVIQNCLNMTMAMKIQAECSACEEVLDILQARLEEEKPGETTIDLRNRLDANGQRQGKKVEYKNSELRVTNLLDELCRELRFHSVTTNKSEDVDRWRRMKEHVRKGQNEAFHKRMSAKLESYCAFLLDEYEDEISTYIREYEMGDDIVDKFCTTFLQACPETSHADKNASNEEL